MRRMSRKAVLAALLAAPAGLQPVCAAAQDAAAPAVTEREGSLYPPAAGLEANGALAEALGPARYILNDIGQSESFSAAVRRAIGVHPIFHREVSRLAEARAHARAERAALYPRLSASLSGDYVIAREFGPNTDNVVEALRPGAQFNGALSVSQLLFDGGATFQRIKGARAHAREQDKSIGAQVNRLALDALSAWYDLAAHQAILRLGEEFIRRHERLLEDVREKDRLGTGTRADVMQATARLAAARARVSGIRESMRLAEIRYEELFKQEPGVLARPSYEALAVSSRDEAAKLAVGRNPEIGAAEARSDRATAEYRAARSSRLPEVRANVSAVKYDIFDGSDDYDLRAGVNLNYDIFAGGARGAAISQAGELARQQKYDEARVRQEIERDAAIAFERRLAANERLESLGDAVIAHAAARDLIAERFRVARGDLIDVLQTENDYFESGVAYIAGLADRDMSTFSLMEHTGDLLRYFSPQPDLAPAPVYGGETQ